MINPNTTKFKIPNKSQTQKIYDIRERTFKFAERILEIAEMLPSTPACNVIRTQLIKSGTSVGANMEEADGTVTKPDFVNKVVIARKEAKETHSWLKLIKNKYIKDEFIFSDVEEIREIINIFSAIITKTRK